MSKHTMTYRDYLDAWALRFGDDTTGEYGCWIEGKRRVIKAHRLSEAKFTKHLKALDSATDKYNAALEHYDGGGVTEALRDAFPHELALLI